MLASLHFLFNATTTTEIYTLSLHDALPILYKFRQAVDTLAQIRLRAGKAYPHGLPRHLAESGARREADAADRKSTRLNSSHSQISYAVFCLKKKNYKLFLSENQYINITMLV